MWVANSASEKLAPNRTEQRQSHNRGRISCQTPTHSPAEDDDVVVCGTYLLLLLFAGWHNKSNSPNQPSYSGAELYESRDDTSLGTVEEQS